MSKKLQYSVGAMEAALEAVRSGASSQRAACKEFGVPRGTLQDKLAGRVPEGRRMGPNTILIQDEEQSLETWIKQVAKRGFPRKKIDLINTVQKIIDEDGRPNPFRNNRPGETWYRQFLKRHPNIAVRTAESVNKARGSVTEERIRNWFTELREYLQENDHLDILEDGSRILNADETNFQLSPKSGKVLGIKGWKNIYEVVPGNEKETITVLCTLNASGDVIKGMVVFPYKRPPKVLVDSVPETWAIGLSDSGWMKAETFYEYVANILHPWLLEHNVKLPVLFFVDGHTTHLTLQLSNFCSQNGIILYCLYPNATHILQPADVSVFKPLKLQWRHHVREWQSQNLGKCLTRVHFTPILDKAMKKISRLTISNGFKACGLYPFNPDAIDYSKCIASYVCETCTSTHTSTTESVPNANCPSVEMTTHSRYDTAATVIQELLDTGLPKDIDILMQKLKSQTQLARNVSPDIVHASVNRASTSSSTHVDIPAGAIITDLNLNIRDLDLHNSNDPTQEDLVVDLDIMDFMDLGIPILQDETISTATDIQSLLETVNQNRPSNSQLLMSQESESILPTCQRSEAASRSSPPVALSKSPVPGTSAQSSTPVALSKSPVPGTSAQSPTPVALSKSPVPGTSAQSPTPVALPKSPVPGTSGQSPTPVALSESPVEYIRLITEISCFNDRPPRLMTDIRMADIRFSLADY